MNIFNLRIYKKSFYLTARKMSCSATKLKRKYVSVHILIIFLKKVKYIFPVKRFFFYKDSF